MLKKILLELFPDSGNWLTAARIFFTLGIFSLPLTIRSLVYTGSSFSLGFFNEFTAFFIYASEIFWLVSFACVGVAIWRDELKELDFNAARSLAPILLTILAATTLAVLPATDPVLALLHLWRGLILSLAASLLAANLLPAFFAVKVLAVSLSMQAVVATGQFIGNGSLGLSFLGESIFTTMTFNIAKIGDAVRGMGTLPHANILGGLLALGLLSLAAVPKKSLTFYVAAVIMLSGLFFTFSRAAALAFFSGMFLLTAGEPRRRTFSLLATLAIFGSLIYFWRELFWLRLTESANVGLGRLEQLRQAAAIIQENFFGVGWGGYTPALAEIEPLLKNWQLQPVHNFFVLKTVEESLLTATVWLGSWLVLIWRNWKARQFPALAWFAAALVLANFDHYLATSFAGEAVLFLGLAEQNRNEQTA